ncbi:hypothetical protein GGS23DRAFT_512322 [Durotheca rogersii]|uniref:uncharacterized protein n=1 Tax=Durotheca rogersii TaxID=419775 RepID=UPI00221F051C|nr:uncharacterized protein GGS23DRAFT_512322 [Durotheca rogersii]KAI5863747.1 hypothetical protein GGS23DRAFT_512322 [Durotheca rogersii]
MNSPPDNDPDNDPDTEPTGSEASFPFTKLPLELQFLVWDYYRDSLPVIRHCFSISSEGRRIYATYDEGSLLIVDRHVSQKDDSSSYLPYMTKIRFTGHILAPRSYGAGFPSDDASVSLRQVFICADLERDVFHFNYRGRPVHGLDEWFCFLRNPIRRHPPPELPRDHWISQVRNLTLTHPRTGTLTLSDWDRHVLSRMRRLRTVHLSVCPQARLHAYVVGTSVFTAQTLDTFVSQYASIPSLQSEFESLGIYPEFRTCLDPKGLCMGATCGQAWLRWHSWRRLIFI